jgi:hypothetical protein
MLGPIKNRKALKTIVAISIFEKGTPQYMTFLRHPEHRETPFSYPKNSKFTLF